MKGWGDLLGTPKTTEAAPGTPREAVLPRATPTGVRPREKAERTLGQCDVRAVERVGCSETRKCPWSHKLLRYQVM